MVLAAVDIAAADAGVATIAGVAAKAWNAAVSVAIIGAANEDTIGDARATEKAAADEPRFTCGATTLSLEALIWRVLLNDIVPVVKKFI